MLMVAAYRHHTAWNLDVGSFRCSQECVLIGADVMPRLEMTGQEGWHQRTCDYAFNASKLRGSAVTTTRLFSCAWRDHVFSNQNPLSKTSNEINFEHENPFLPYVHARIYRRSLLLPCHCRTSRTGVALTRYMAGWHCIVCGRY